MYTESVAIIILILLMAYFAMRSEKKEFAGSVLPLVIVPLFNLLTMPSTKLLRMHLTREQLGGVNVAINILGLVVACVVLGILSRQIQSRAGRRIYLLLCAGFSAALTLVYIIKDIALYVG